MTDTNYQCCFCGETIPHVSPDVGGLLYYTCADRGETSSSGAMPRASLRGFIRQPSCMCRSF